MGRIWGEGRSARSCVTVGSWLDFETQSACSTVSETFVSVASTLKHRLLVHPPEKGLND